MGPLGRTGQLKMGRKWSARAAQEFLGCAGAAPARQDGLEAAPAKMSLNKGKSAAPGVGGCNAMTIGHYSLAGINRGSGCTPHAAHGQEGTVRLGSGRATVGAALTMWAVVK